VRGKAKKWLKRETGKAKTKQRMLKKCAGGILPTPLTSQSIKEVE
jgi:hypothetical protein